MFGSVHSCGRHIHLRRGWIWLNPDDICIYQLCIIYQEFIGNEQNDEKKSLGRNRTLSHQKDIPADPSTNAAIVEKKTKEMTQTDVTA